MIKYPIEIEITDFCSLACTSCINPMLANKSFISEEDYVSILHYIYDNKDDVLYINMSGIGDIFMHPDICKFLEKFIEIFERSGVKLLIPTKGQTIQDKHLDLFEKIQASGISLNISVGIYSVRETIYNRLAGGGKTYRKTTQFLKDLRKRYIPFSIELLINPFSVNEKSEFIKIAKALQCDYAFQSYHNFSGLILGDDFGGNTCTFTSDEDYIFDDFYCSFIPFFDCRGNIYSCSVSGKDPSFLIGDTSSKITQFPVYTEMVGYIKGVFLSEKKCNTCSIYKDYERKTPVGNHSNESV